MQALHPFGTTPQRLSPFETYGTDAQKYGKVSAKYDNGRPDYPLEPLRAWFRKLNLTRDTLILDLAAGTGKLTKAMLSIFYNTEHPENVVGSNIHAVEVVDGMRDEFHRLYPNIPIQHGYGEIIPVDQNMVEVVTVGTAFHWFKGEQALQEIAQILKPNGKLLLLWHMLDPLVEAAPWVAPLRRLVSSSGGPNNHDTDQWKQAFVDDTLFTNPFAQHTTHTYTVKMTRDEIVKSLETYNAAGEMSLKQLDELRQKVNEILNSYPSVKDKCVLDVPYRLEMYECTKRDPRRSQKLASSLSPADFAAATSAMHSIEISRARSYVYLPPASGELNNDDPLATAQS
jgi:SAM-dependent methyltransferase